MNYCAIYKQRTMLLYISMNHVIIYNYLIDCHNCVALSKKIMIYNQHVLCTKESCIKYTLHAHYSTKKNVFSLKSLKPRQHCTLMKDLES